MNYKLLDAALDGRKRMDFQISEYGSFRVNLDCNLNNPMDIFDFIEDRWDSKFRELTFESDSENFEAGIDAAKGFIYLKRGVYYIEFRLYQRADQTRWRRSYVDPEVIEREED